MIQAIDLSKRYEDGLLAQDHLNLRVDTGQIYCLLGANGAGKTTAINLFFNFIEPTGGTAKINNMDCAERPLETRKYAAYVSENVMLYGNFTARQNLDFFTRLAGRTHLKKREGKKKVRLTLRNTTGGLIEGHRIDLEDFEGIRTDQIANVYVSLLDDAQSIISQPYEVKIAVMPYNQPITIEFRLLRDLDQVTVKSVYGNTADEKKIFLQKDESANTVLMTSGQFSQEANLGTRATYDLTLELFSSMDNAYKLEALDLPRQITFEFLDVQTGVKLSRR